ncbi:MAG TPA: hypothetical protein P5107_10795, partial [Thermotogota bacterium]|nr:hypothetical protein [Thermotogota bacterium]
SALFEEYRYFENRSFKTVFFTDDADQIKEAFNEGTNKENLLFLSFDEDRELIEQVFDGNASVVFIVSFEKSVHPVIIHLLEKKEQSFEYFSFVNQYGIVAFPVKNTDELKYQVNSYISDFVKRNQKNLFQHTKKILKAELSRVKKEAEENNDEKETLYEILNDQLEFIQSELDDLLYNWLSDKSQKYAFQAKEVVDQFSEKDFIQSYSEKIHKLQREQLEAQAEEDGVDLQEILLKRLDVLEEINDKGHAKELFFSLKDYYANEDYDFDPEIQRVPLLTVDQVVETGKAFFKFIIFSFTDLSKLALNASVAAIICFSGIIMNKIHSVPFVGQSQLANQIVFFLWIVMFISVFVFFLSNLYLFLNINKIKKLNISKKVLHKLYRLNSETFFYDQLHERYASLFNEKNEIIISYKSKIKDEKLEKQEDQDQIMAHLKDLEELMTTEFNMLS